MTDLYPKIQGPYTRHVEGPDRNKLIVGSWTSPELKALAALDFVWTEKIDGTNIRVFWDGYRVSFGGRTDNAQIPASLVNFLSETFSEEIFEQSFGETAVILYGEGYGPKIQKGGGRYSDSPSFALFDVKINDWWLLRLAVEDIADKLGIGLVPLVGTFSIPHAIQIVERGFYSKYGNEEIFLAEGLVGTQAQGLLTRSKQRIQVKVKTVDFYKGE